MGWAGGKTGECPRRRGLAPVRGNPASSATVRDARPRSRPRTAWRDEMKVFLESFVTGLRKDRTKGVVSLEATL